MSRNKKPNGKLEFVLFDVHYEDGSMTSNRRVPGSLLGGLEGDAPAEEAIRAQDDEIAERSGRPRPPIKEIVRSKTK
ncbi:MAG: hypothetical protein R3D68_19340 [Hyphomicrobiaceae bacterium]